MSLMIQCVRQCVRQSVRPTCLVGGRVQTSSKTSPLLPLFVVSTDRNCRERTLGSVRHFNMSAQVKGSHGQGFSLSFNDAEIIKFLNQTFELMKTEALQKGTDRAFPVVQFEHPKDLQKLLNLEIGSQGSDHETLLEEMGKIVKYSVKSGHPHFFNQLYGGLDPYSQAGAWLTETINSNIHTYEVSPVFIVMEKYLFGKMCQIVGYKNGEGLFCPGGSASNIMALHLARYRKFPNVKEDGMYGLPKLRCYVSEDGHYSLKKAAPYLGLGLSNVVTIATDAKGKVCVDDLERKVKEDLDKGFVPLFMMATSGSTVLGAFDDLVGLSEVCQKYDIWLHDDACWGGGALLSKKYKHLCEGTDRCDSVAWNFHKFTGCPVQASAFLVKDKGVLNEANRYRAEYLFQPDKFYDSSYDIGDNTIQCGRKVDVVKVWLQWKAMGDSGFESLVNRGYDNATYLTKKLASTDGFKLVLPEFECTNICFWYIPPRLRGQEETEEWWQEVSKVAPKVKEGMVKQGTMMIGYNPLSTKGLVNFFRLIVHNPLCDHSDMDFVLGEIERLGRDL